MFKPTEIIFAATNACNLHCSHCYVTRSSEKLDIEDAKRFLKSCQNTSIEKIGFSGGEPFLYKDFLIQIIKESIKLDFMFDQIMTNGVWWNTQDELKNSLQEIYDAGYDGKIGLSFDTFHNQDFDKILHFIITAQNLFGGQSIEIQSVIDSKNDLTVFNKLAESLNCTIEKKLNHKTNSGIIIIKNDNIFLPVYREPQCFSANNKKAWESKKWFKEDYCEGPGHIFYIHSDGNIAPCCGFANECTTLFIGKITDNYDTVMKKASENSLIKACYETGLLNEVKKLKKKKIDFPGKTDNICTFCEWVSNFYLK